ncbi:alanine/glycine:cation symporter family protein [Aliagarivorans taiwanensis]|uniref:alanine/glycine:cation symporter family protein n=1 Tax=Aliagarivorans taiwanensis TaxID=561966 RepID=UPI000687B146|nr:alanine/glycine:cation symporter family protein [Aliagarivorans taiwanensis]
MLEAVELIEAAEVVEQAGLIETAINTLNGLLWSHLIIYALVGAGIFFTFRLGFVQFRMFKHGVSVLKGGQSQDASGLSSKQVFWTSMAARVGTGNMAGVVVAITAGGPGAVFWMWAIAMLGMATAFVESTLAQVYRVKEADGQYRGGPAYYMEQGLNARWLGALFSVLLIIAFGFAFNGVQANTIADSLGSAYGFNETYVGIAIVAATAWVITGGLKKIGKVASTLVPVMALAYLSISLVVILLNISELPGVLVAIVKSAFGMEQAAGGLMGALMAGVARGLFSNEAGMGSAANIAASANPNPNHPAAQGFVQMLGVFADTIVICTATAAMVLIVGVDFGGELGGIGLLQSALADALGSWTAYFMTFAIMLFCFTSIFANYSYAETNLVFLTKNKVALYVFRALVLAMVMVGSVASLNIVWDFADVSMGLMALVNIAAIVALSKVAFAVFADYEKQLKAGKKPSFNAATVPGLEAQLVDPMWKDQAGSASPVGAKLK